MTYIAGPNHITMKQSTLVLVLVTLYLCMAYTEGNYEFCCHRCYV